MAAVGLGIGLPLLLALIWAAVAITIQRKQLRAARAATQADGSSEKAILCPVTGITIKQNDGSAGPLPPYGSELEHNEVGEMDGCPSTYELAGDEVPQLAAVRFSGVNSQP